MEHLVSLIDFTNELQLSLQILIDIRCFILYDIDSPLKIE